MEQILNALGPIIVFAIALMVPIALILTKHQQRMALIMSAKTEKQDNPRIEAQLDEIRQLIYSQALAIDNLANRVSEIKNPAIREREALKTLSQ